MTYRKEFYIMNKICLIILCTCHTTPQLEGTWTCEKSPLEIDKDLSFNIYDAEAGNLWRLLKQFNITLRIINCIYHISVLQEIEDYIFCFFMLLTKAPNNTISITAESQNSTFISTSMKPTEKRLIN